MTPTPDKPTGEALAPDGFNNGFDPQRERLHTVAAIIDKPSLYMGGPSRQSLDKSKEILSALDALPSPLPVDIAIAALSLTPPPSALEDDVVAVLTRLEPHLDAIVCYASTMGEHEPNRIAHDIRALLTRIKDSSK